MYERFGSGIPSLSSCSMYGRFGSGISLSPCRYVWTFRNLNPLAFRLAYRCGRFGSATILPTHLRFFPFIRITFSTLCCHLYTECVGSTVYINVGNSTNLHGVASCQKMIFKDLISYSGYFDGRFLCACALRCERVNDILCFVSAAQCQGAAGGVCCVSINLTLERDSAPVVARHQL